MVALGGVLQPKRWKNGRVEGPPQKVVVSIFFIYTARFTTVASTVQSRWGHQLVASQKERIPIAVNRLDCTAYEQ